jgi:hypothetical protein
LGLELAIGAMRRNHLYTLLLHRLIQRVTVVRLRRDHVEVEAELHQRDLMMIRRVRAHRQRQTAVAIDNGRDLDALAASGLANFGATALG